MFRPLLQAMLALLLSIPANAQQNFPYRRLYPDPHRPGTFLDSSQIKLLQARQDYTSKEIARIKDSIRTLQSTTLPHYQTTTLTSGLSHSQTHILSNACGTRASFTPANDTTLYEGQTISFTNTSQNADYYEWYIDVNNRTTGTHFNNFVPAIGITPIMLVAHRGSCADTAISYVVRNGTPPTDPKRMITSYGLPVSNEWASCITTAKSDGYLLAGFSGNSIVDFNPAPYFIRISETGCILWSKTLPVVVQQNQAPEIATYPGSVITTYDSGFVADLTNGNYSGPDLVKFDKNGNILWARNYYSNHELALNSVVKELSDHSLMIRSGVYSDNFFVLTSLDETGLFRWQKKYYVNSQDLAVFTDLISGNDLVDLNGSVWLTGRYQQNNSSSPYIDIPMLFKVDVATGNLLWAKGYISPNKNYLFSGIHFYKDGLIMNGFADSLVVPYNNEWSNFETLLETDLDGNIRDGRLIYNGTELNAVFGDNLIVHADNSISLFYSGEQTLSVQPGFADHSYFLRLDANKNILWQNQYTVNGIGLLKQLTSAPSKGLAMIGQRINSLLNPFYGFSENLILLKVDSNGKGPDANCDIYKTFNTMQELSVTPFSPGPVTVTDLDVQVVDRPLNVTNPNTELRYNCPDYVPPCSFMKLSGKNFICDLKDTLEFIAHKDPSCADPIKWTYDVSNIKTVYEDGGKTRLLFKTAGIYKILAEKPFPCSSITDSIIVTVARSLINFSLGGDTTLCTGDSITLRPQGKYDQYLWQDGSANDSFKVKTAGLYYCMVTDSCRNTKIDTIQIDFSSSIPIDLGAPRLKCASDSLTIVPPSGFKLYEWTPDYNLIPTSGLAVILYPAKDTSYQLTVHDYGGCAGTTRLKINVFPGSPVTLGNDTAVCTGVHVVFSVGGNFQSYAWSNGSAASSIDVQVAGKYSVLVKDQNNCNSSDTVLLKVYPPPAVNITGGTVFCKDQNLVLNAGAGFSDYRWQDGSDQESFTAPDTGFYRVQVTDQHKCVSADSIHIAQYATAPQGFLPPDTAVCLIRGGTLTPQGEFAQHNWSTGETTKTIQVKTAGDFILQVVDNQGCRGTDTIHVTTKDCEPLLVCPNAFTPNNDGLNDVFRLKYPGTIEGYQIQIFNRWGQMIFSSSDPFSGWDGKFSNELQPTGTYVWIIRYTDRSGEKQNINGTVVLIR